MANFSKLAATIDKFDGTNWPTWSFAFRAALMYGNIWNIADGKEPRPTPLTASTNSTPPVTQADVDARDAQIVDWDRREQKGRALLALVVKASIYQSINLSETLMQNWQRLTSTYGLRTGLNAWVDFRTYITTTFDTTSPITQQIDALSELKAKIIEGGLTVTDQLYALVVLGALPTPYETIQSSILGSYTDLTKITFIDVRARILAEELCQSSSASVSAIYRPGTKPGTSSKKSKDKNKSKDTCGHCGKLGHWAEECYAKKAGLSKEEARDEKKRKEAIRAWTKKNKGKAAEVNASAAVVEDENTDTYSNVLDTDVNDTTPAFVFYIARTTDWMIDSGCTEHMTPFATDIVNYRPSSSTVTLADQKTRINIAGKGYVTSTTLVNGKQVEIRLLDVYHIPGIGKWLLSTRHLDQ